MADNMHPFDESRVINKFIQKTTILNFILTVNFVCEQKQSINGISEACRNRFLMW